MEDELIDIVSDDDVVIGVEKKNNLKAKGITHFRAIAAFIINDAGKIWIPRRHPNKAVLPLYLDTSVGGHVSSGETYEEALIRETAEELNIALTEYRFLGKFTPPLHGTAAFVQAYAIDMNETPAYNPEEFIETFWLTPQEVLDLIARGEKAKHDLPILVKNIWNL